MQKRFLVVLLSFVFILSFSIDAEAQSRKKKKGKQRPAKTEEIDEKSSDERSSSQRSGSQRSSRDNGDDGPFFTKDKLAYDLLGNFGIANGGGNTVLKFGLKPAVSFKVLPRVAFGLAPKIEYYFTNIVDREDLSEFDLGLEAFGRVLLIESIYLQVGYDWNNYIFNDVRRNWYNSPVIGGGYMSGFGNWKYGAQALFMLSEERRDYGGIVELWFGFTYNL